MEQSFYRWLNATWRGEYVDLRAYLDRNAEDWRFVQNMPQGWALIEADAGLSADAQMGLKQKLAQAFVAFERAKPGPGSRFGVNAYGLGVFLFMAAILAILAAAIFEPVVFSWFGVTVQKDGSLLQQLADFNTARGLITFVFTVGVIALSLIIVTANVTGADEDGKRFERSKEILTSMIAILGTILGFYFGKADAPKVPTDGGVPPGIGAPEDPTVPPGGGGDT